MLAITIVVLAALLGLAFDRILSSPSLVNYAFSPEIAFSLLGALPLIGLVFVIISHRQAGWRKVPYWSYLAAIVIGAFVGWLGYGLASSLSELRNELPDLRMKLDSKFPDQLLLIGTTTAKGLNLIVVKPNGGEASSKDVCRVINEDDSSKGLVRKILYVGFNHPIFKGTLSNDHDISAFINEIRPSIVDSLEVWTQASVFVGFGYRVKVGVFQVVVERSDSQMVMRESSRPASLLRESSRPASSPTSLRRSSSTN
jgi:hypothetical protein